MLFKGIMTSASGSTGGITASHNKSGLYFRARRIPVNTNTANQQVIRSAFGTLAQRWSDVLTGAQRDGWNLYGSNVPIPNALGDPVAQSGISAYQRCNTSRVQAGLAIVDTPPTDFTLGEAPVLADAEFEVGANATVTLGAGNAWASVDGATLLLYQGKPVSGGRTFYAGPYRFMGSLDGDSVIPPTEFANITVNLPFPATAGSLSYVAGRVSYPDGRLSSRARVLVEVA